MEIEIYKKIQKQLQEHQGCVLQSAKKAGEKNVSHTLQPMNPENLKYPDLLIPAFEQTEDEWIFTEPFISKGRLYILGAGHVGKALAKLCSRLDFEVILIDDRKEFLSGLENYKNIQTIDMDFIKALDCFQPGPEDYVCIMTRGHSHDFDCLEKIISSPLPRYIGQIGSKRKMTQFFESLKASGVPEDILKQIHSPIGLDIGARTPDEIAVSIAAELIQTRASAAGKKRSEFESDVLDCLDKLNDPACVCTIVKSSGSVPRGAGSKMFVDKDTIYGTIGGGLAEAKVIEAARSMPQDQEYAFCEFSMDSDMASKEGLICGGNILVFIERITQTG